MAPKAARPLKECPVPRLHRTLELKCFRHKGGSFRLRAHLMDGTHREKIAWLAQDGNVRLDELHVALGITTEDLDVELVNYLRSGAYIRVPQAGHSPRSSTWRSLIACSARVSQLGSVRSLESSLRHSASDFALSVVARRPRLITSNLEFVVLAWSSISP